MPIECENCKANPVDIARNTVGTPTAKLIAILEAHGITSAFELAEIVGISDRAIRKSRNLSSGTTVPGGTTGPELQDRRGTTVLKTEPQFRNSGSEPSRACATKESPTEIVFTQSQQQQSRETEVADAQQLFKRLSAAVGEAMNPLSVNMQVVAEPRGWIKAGADLDADIIPVVEAMAKKAKRHGIKSWNYFGQAVADAAAARKAGLPTANLPKTADVLPIKLTTPTFLKPKLEAANA